VYYIVDIMKVSIIPPKSWGVYFPEEQFDPNDRKVSLINELVNYFRNHEGWDLITKNIFQYQSSTILDLDYQHLSSTCHSSDLCIALANAPDEALDCIGAAAYDSLYTLPPPPPFSKPQDLIHIDSRQPSKVLVRLYNYQSSIVAVSQANADVVGQLITVRGTICRLAPVRPLVTAMPFICQKCESQIEVFMPDGIYDPPVSCGFEGCRSRSFQPAKHLATCIDWQRIAVQGLSKDEKNAGNTGGGVPRPLDVELCGDLTSICGPGDVVTISGILKVESEIGAGNGGGGGRKRKAGGGGGGGENCISMPFLKAISVRGLGKDALSGPGAAAITLKRQGIGMSHSMIDHHHAGTGGSSNNKNNSEELNFLPPNVPGFAKLDLQFIKMFTDTCEGDQLRQLVLSLCPRVYGQEMVKAGLVLALFGGVRKLPTTPLTNNNNHSNSSVPIRGDIHVLMVGDPGLAKSTLLKAAAAAAPRGIYVCGAGSSSAGLTVSIIREGGEMSFDPGALVLADRGVCCVDEFDKSTCDHQSLLCAMEQQEVTVAKAGLIASLPARTTVLAAANPQEGSYNRGKSLAENLCMLSPAMISRFDLVFLMLDRPNVDRDNKLSEHVLAKHTRGGMGGGGMGGGAGDQHQQSMLLALPSSSTTTSREKQALLIKRETTSCLADRLQVKKPDDEPLPLPLFRKYVAYARQYCHPTLSPPAAAILKDHYLKLRHRGAANGGTSLPVTHRALESLIRMSEARARVELREEVTAQDALDAIEVMQATHDGMLAEGPGCIDFMADGGGGARRGAAQAERRRFMEAVRRWCQMNNNNNSGWMIESHDLYDIADKIELAMPDTRAFLDYLNEQGDLLKKGNGRWQVM
jgi:DNA helicase MCM8